MEAVTISPEITKCPRCGAIGNRLNRVRFMFFCANCLIHFSIKGDVFVVTPDGKLMKESRLKKEAETMAYGDKTKRAREVLAKERLTELLAQGNNDEQIAQENELEVWQVRNLKREYGLAKSRGKAKILGGGYQKTLFPIRRLNNLIRNPSRLLMRSA